jgi:hypothetical protein
LSVSLGAFRAPLNSAIRSEHASASGGPSQAFCGFGGGQFHQRRHVQPGPGRLCIDARASDVPLFEPPLLSMARKSITACRIETWWRFTLHRMTTCAASLCLLCCAPCVLAQSVAERSLRVIHKISGTQAVSSAAAVHAIRTIQGDLEHLWHLRSQAID